MKPFTKKVIRKSSVFVLTMQNTLFGFTAKTDVLQDLYFEGVFAFNSSIN